METIVICITLILITVAVCATVIMYAMVDRDNERLEHENRELKDFIHGLEVEEEDGK